MAERLYSLDQVADLLGSPPADVAAWIRTGWLAGETLPGGGVRVSEAGLVRFLKDRGVDLEAVLASAARRQDAGPAEVGAGEPASPAAAAGPSAPAPAAAAPSPAEKDASLAPPQDLVEGLAQPDKKVAATFSGEPGKASAPAPVPCADLGSDAAGRLAEAILGDAIRRRAEAIHLEPRPDGLVLLLRIDGHLRQKPNFRARLPKDLAPRLAERLKVLADLRPDGPPTGTFRVALNGGALEFRVAACPTACGERLVIRPADGAADLSLDALGMTAEDVAKVRGMLAETSGLLVVAGPPRSGRTATLRAMIAHLAPEDRKTLAVARDGSYATAGAESVPAPNWGEMAERVQAAAAQDTAVLVVDEVRDGRTAAAAVWAALDGHLVLAALASRARWPDPTALVSPQVDAVALSTTLVGMMVQRLVRTVCPHCKREVQAEGAVLESLGGKGATVAAAGGCPRCYQTGYAGRTGLFSVLRLDEPLGKGLAAGTPALAMHQAARQAGLKSLWQAGLAKVRDRQTTLDEIIRVLKPA